MQKEAVELFVVGLPVTMNGQPSENQSRVRSFVEKLRKEIPQIPVAFYDERFTSVIAHQTMLAGGMRKRIGKTKLKLMKLAQQ